MKITKNTSELMFNPDALITNPEILGKRVRDYASDDPMNKEKKEFTDDGLFSKRIFGDIENTEDDYSCKCGNLKGKYYRGVICQKCGTAVEFVAPNIDKTGWIDLTGTKYSDDGGIIEQGRDYKVIKYISYLFLEKIIGRENLKNIIHIPDTITEKGELDTEAMEAERKTSDEKKYWYIGIIEFYAKYAEILDYYYDLHKINDLELKEFVSDPYDVFTSKIPVVSAVLRPAMRTADGLKLDESNNIYIRILKMVKMLTIKTEPLPIIVNAALGIIQDEYFNLNEYYINAIRSKEGLIRSQLCGVRVNYSARSIITPPDASLKIDELIIPYRTFLELYKFEIINEIKNIKSVSYKEAETIHFNAGLEFNEEIYLLMKDMIIHNEVGVLFNRNPTINIGSIVYLKIVDIKRDIDDMTMSANITIMTMLNGDYDGDTLNIVSIKDRGARELFKQIFSPINLMIDPKNGKFNNDLNLERDQILGLNTLLM